MAEQWKSQPIEVYKEWLKTIQEEASDNLTDWESNFIDNMEWKLGNDWNLTQNQAESLERIYAAKTK